MSLGWFQLPFRGSALILFVGSLLFLLSMLGVGLIISVISNTQQEAIFSTFIVNFPAALLSELIFPIDAMPTVAQWITYLNPLRYYMTIARGVYLKGNGLDLLWFPLTMLTVLAVTFLTIAILSFRKTI